MHSMRNLLLLLLLSPMLSSTALQSMGAWTSENTLPASTGRAFGCMHASCDPSWPGFFWITSLLYNTDARLEGRKRERRVRMDRNGSEPAQYAWSSVRERGGVSQKASISDLRVLHEAWHHCTHY